MIAMAGCRQTVATSPSNDQPQPAAAAQSTSVAEEPIVVETPTPTPEVKVEWQTLTYQWEDKDGYKFEATVKVSPWINAKNETYLSTAWNEISQDKKSLPEADPDQWGLESANGDYYSPYSDSGFSFLPTENITDIYYCVGEISVKNLTDGWSITTAAPITSNALWLSASQPEIDAEGLKDNYLREKYMNSRTMGAEIEREDWGTEYSLRPTWLRYNPKYTSDTWGPATFAFAHFESKTPNTPGGEHMSEITETFFCVDGMFGPVTESTTKTKLSVIDYDG